MPLAASPIDRAASLAVRILAALRLPGAKLSVVSEEETLRALRERHASIARYGDGELEVMIGGSIYFQEYDALLARRLRQILRQPGADFLIGIPNFDRLQIKTKSRRGNWQRYRRLFSHLLRHGASYHSAFVSRPASVGIECAEYFREWETLWANRNVVVIHSTAATAAHPLFRGAKSVNFVPCPPKNAFRGYDEILGQAAGFVGASDPLFLIAAGPTAGVLAWDLAQRGAQALDVGHLTAAYDEFIGKQ